MQLLLNCVNAGPLAAHFAVKATKAKVFGGGNDAEDTIQAIGE
ncbi:hypothetical protein ADG881_1220 [Alcanivorax sp. DG881]|nr:hypothetical protein ADG881_1220 [Alcanivorax sp. DG881]